jgi:hypothetical protein
MSGFGGSSICVFHNVGVFLRSYGSACFDMIFSFLVFSAVQMCTLTVWCKWFAAATCWFRWGPTVYWRIEFSLKVGNSAYASSSNGWNVLLIELVQWDMNGFVIHAILQFYKGKWMIGNFSCLEKESKQSRRNQVWQVCHSQVQAPSSLDCNTKRSIDSWARLIAEDALMQ